MKYLLMLLLIAACGKHHEPGKLDLSDRDGDQIPDAYEASDFDKNVADITPYGDIEVEMSFQQGMMTVEKSVFLFENKPDLPILTKDLMVKNSLVKTVDDYFSELSVLHLKNSKVLPEINEEIVSVRMFFKNFNQRKTLTLLSKDSKIDLGSFSGTADLKFSKKTLESILKGESYIALSRVNKKYFFPNSQEDDIKEKTYRVFLDDGHGIKVYYVSKKFKFEAFLEHFKINEYKMIDEANLLTTSLYSTSPEWWIRNINSKDKVLILDNLKNLSDHYLLGFKKEKHVVQRLNGVSKNIVAINKTTSSKALIKIRPLKINSVFIETPLKESYKRGRLSENGKEWTCLNKYRNVTNKVEVLVSKADIKKALDVRVNGTKLETYLLTTGKDERGVFWEIGISVNVTQLEMNLLNLPMTEYVQTGLFHSKCSDSEPGLKIDPRLQAIEDHFELNVEAFIENI